MLKGSFEYRFVRDTNGAKLRIAFHTEQRGSELSPANLEPGNTVLVLYAHAHRFVDLSVGLRQEEVGTVKVSNWPCYADTACLSSSEGSPLGLGRLFAPEKRFSLNGKETGEKQCWGCNNDPSVPFKCQKCGVAWSCGKVSLERCFLTIA